MVYCAAFGCNADSSKGSKCSWFRFPTERKLLKKWLANMKRAHFTPTKHSRLCSAHFEKSCFRSDLTMTRTFLKENAIPTLFPVVEQMLTPSVRRVTRASSLQSRSTSTTAIASTVTETERADIGTLTRSAYKKRKIHKAEFLATAAATVSSSSTADVAAAAAAAVSSDTETASEGSSGATRHQSSKQCQANIGPLTRNRRIQTSILRKQAGVHVAPDMKSVGVMCTLLTAPIEMSASSEDDVVMEESDDVYIESASVSTTDSNSDSDDHMVYYDDNEEQSRRKTVLHEGTDPFTERYFLVSESALCQLLSRCRQCGSGTTTILQQVIGTLIVVVATCPLGHIMQWESQRRHLSMPWGNLRCAAAILFSGGSATQAITLAGHLNMPIFSQRTFNKLQRCYLMPAIVDTWREEQRLLVESVTGQSLIVGGDGRCDSPGYSAKYGSYTMMDLQRQRVLDVQLVQSNEVTSSVAMELEGLKRSLGFLEANGLVPSTVVTDRHGQIKKYMRDQEPNIHHHFDVWHVAKGVGKKLEKAAKGKDCEEIRPWIKSITNHMFWVAASSGDDGDAKSAKWKSLLNHVANIHEGHSDKFPRCEHGELEDRQWITKGSKAYKVLEKILLNGHLTKDICCLSSVYQTYSLEVFHNVMNKFLPKSTHYWYAGMIARIYLAILHYNENADRPQARRMSDGELQWRVVFPRAKKGSEAVVKPVKEKLTYGYITKLMDAVKRRRLQFSTYCKAMEAASQLGILEPPPLTASYQRVSKRLLIDRHRSRF